VLLWIFFSVLDLGLDEVGLDVVVLLLVVVLLGLVLVDEQVFDFLVAVVLQLED